MKNTPELTSKVEESDGKVGGSGRGWGSGKRVGDPAL